MCASQKQGLLVELPVERKHETQAYILAFVCEKVYKWKYFSRMQ